MAALLRRAFPPLLPLATRSAASSSSYLIPLEVNPPRSSSFSVLFDRLFAPRFLPFSTAAATEHSTLVRSVVQKCPIFRHYNVPPPPSLPIPDGFPFALTHHLATLTFTRQDKDEKFQVHVHWDSPILVDGNQCYLMDASITRGSWLLNFSIIAGSKMLRIHSVQVRKCSEEDLLLCDDLLKSKGINKGTIRSLVSLEKNKDELTDYFKPGNERCVDFNLPIAGVPPKQ